MMGDDDDDVVSLPTLEVGGRLLSHGKARTRVGSGSKSQLQIAS